MVGIGTTDVETSQNDDMICKIIKHQLSANDKADLYKPMYRSKATREGLQTQLELMGSAPRILRYCVNSDIICKVIKHKLSANDEADLYKLEYHSKATRKGFLKHLGSMGSVSRILRYCINSDIICKHIKHKLSVNDEADLHKPKYRSKATC